MMKIDRIKSKDQNPVDGPYIPNSIMHDILSRVSEIKSLMNCFLVCTTWAEIISSSDFAKLHLSRSPTICLLKPSMKKKYLLAFNSSYNDKMITFVPYITLPSNPVTLTNTCNGLLCLNSKYGNNIYVINPLLMEYITIPIPSDVQHVGHSFCVIGFSHLTNQYKVLVCSAYHGAVGSPLLYKAEIYTLGQGVWRNVLVNDPGCIEGRCRFDDLNEFHDACIDGALHWIKRDVTVSDSVSDKFICCFDFVAEQFRWVPHPSEINVDNKKSSKFYLGAINGNLSLCDCKSDYIDIWVMTEYGVEESWSKQIVIDTFMIGSCCRPLMVKGDGKVILASKCGSYMLLYNSKSQALECELMVPEGMSSTPLQTVGYIPSLISLMDVAPREHATVIRR